MIHDNPYDQAAQDCSDEDRRQARAEEAEEFANTVRQLGGLGVYWATLDREDQDAAYEPGDPKRSDFLDREDFDLPDNLTNNATRGE